MKRVFSQSVPTGAINSLFSVGDNSNVVFSRGNLQYKASTNIWRFAANQYDFIGNANSNISSSYSGYIDLFGWGTSGYNHGATCYQPWSTSGGNYYAYGSYTYNLYDETGKADWGYNAISNGGNQENMGWRTLTKKEWLYLFNIRNTSSGLRFAKAKVNDVNGVILLPDYWQSSYYSLNNTNSTSASFSSNTITATQWYSLEQYGAVFLPAAGYRSGTSVNDVGSYGYYWSSSFGDSNYAWCVYIDGSNLWADYSDYRSYGRSVRLVFPSHGYSFGIDASSSPTEGGTVSGSGTYLEGTECTLTATASADYTFAYWTQNGRVVSADATYTFTVGNNRNLVANFTPSLSAGNLNGLFSVDESSSVVFSQGNLQYMATTNTWRFAENQWDYVGDDNENVSETYSDLIDLFGWGTSGYDHGSVCYHPWNTIINHSYYYAYGSGTYNLYDLTGQADWGYNAIINGGNQENDGWRTLTYEEWLYLFNTRITSSGIRYAKANVNNVNGVILLPDDWQSSYYSLSSTNLIGASFVSNIITATQWIALEQHGAVFLPAAGQRCETSVSYANSYGVYWSSSYKNDYGAGCMFFSPSFLYDNYCSRYFGLSVRLVLPSQGYSYGINAIPSPEDGGMVSGSGTYPMGAECTLEAVPATGYTFVSWTEDDVEVSTDAVYSFTVTGGRTMVANFALDIPHGVHFFSGSGGTIATADGENAYYSGEDVIIISSNECQHVTGMTVYKTGDHTKIVASTFDATTGECSFVMPDYDVDVFAFWDGNMHNITYTWTPTGVTNLNISGPATAQCGNTVTVNYKSNVAGYILVNLAATSPCETLIVEFFTPNINNKRKFTMPDCDVTVNGTYQAIELEQLPDICQFQAPGAPEFNITSANYTSYVFKVKKPGTTSWSSFTAADMGNGDKFDVSGIWTYRLDITNAYGTFQSANKQFQVYDNSACNSINVISNPTVGGIVSGSGTYPMGAECTLEAVPAAGYTFVSWTEDDVEVSTDAVYSFTVTGGRTMVANFALDILHGVHFFSGSGGTIATADGENAYYSGEDVIIISTNECQHVTGMTVYKTGDHTKIVASTFDATTGECSFVMPDYDVDVFAFWDGNMHNITYTWTPTGVTNLNISCPATAQCGNTVTVTYKSNVAGYILVNLSATSTCGTVTVEPFIPNQNNKRKFTMPDCDVTVNGTYQAIELEQLPDICQFQAPGAPEFNITSANYTSYVFKVKKPGTTSWSYFTAADMGNGDKFNVAGTWTYRVDITNAYGTFQSVPMNFEVFPASIYNINVNSIPTDGGVVIGDGQYSVCDENSLCTLFACPNEGYTFENWTENGVVISTDATYGFIVSQDRTLEANFSLTSYDITANANPVGGGSFTGTGSYTYGSSCTLTVMPNEGYYFLYWKKGNTMVSTDQSISFVVTGDDTYTAYFGVISYYVEAYSDSDEGGSVTGDGEYPYGSTCTLIATANEGYHFDHWTEDGEVVSIDPSYSFTVVDNEELVAHFSINNYEISASANPIGGGSFTGTGSYVHGSSCTLTVMPNEGYYFLYWKKGNTMVSTDQSISFVVTGDDTYTAYFGVISYYVEAYSDSDEGGSVTGDGEYPYGSTCTLIATANEGYHFDHWTEDGEVVSIDPSYSFIVIENAELTAHFSINSYEITANPNPLLGGTLTGAGSYIHGTSITLTATANEGYTFVNWTENGEEVSTNITYNFTASMARALVANFSLNNYGITAIADPMVGGTVTGTGTYYYGENVTLEATPNEGYSFINWTKNGEEVSADATYSFTATAAGDYVAHFSFNSYVISAEANYPESCIITGAGAYDHGASVTLTVVANTGYIFLNWTKDDVIVSESPSFCFIATESATYVANYLPRTYNITVKANPTSGGTVTGGGSHSHGTTCTLIATPNEGYYFLYWKKGSNQVSTSPSYSFEVTGSGTYTAYFSNVYSQEVTLAEGWNWWAPTVETTLQDFETALGTNGMTIRAEDGSVLSYVNGQWDGSLQCFTLGQMYRIKTLAPCEFTLNGTRPASVSVSLAPGNHWFGYTGDASAAITDVFGAAFNPTEGDKVVSQTGGFTIFNGTAWEGTLTTLIPGQGYVYVSQAQTSKTLTE